MLSPAACLPRFRAAAELPTLGPKSTEDTMSRQKLLPAVILSALLSSCASLRPQMSALSLPSAPLALHGFSVLPPNEEGWHLLGHTENQLDLARNGKDIDESYAIQAWLLKLPEFKSNEEFLQYVKNGVLADGGPRFTVLASSFKPYSLGSGTCIRFHMSSEDHGAQRRTRRSDTMILDVEGMACQHPKEKTDASHLVYSYRHYKGDEDPTLATKADEFFKSIEYSNP
jgi:hypothetical protein